MSAVWIDAFVEKRPVSWHPRAVSLAEVNAERVSAAWFRKGYRVELVTLERLASAVVARPWGPLVWRDGRCLAKNFELSGWMTLDFDEADYSLAQACREWGDCVHVIGTTKSHQLSKDSKRAKDRFRVIVPWQDMITDARTYSYNLHRLVKKYDADTKCKDAARFFWPCREVVSLRAEGYLQPVLPAPPAAGMRERAAGLAARSSIPGFVIRALRRPLVPGERNEKAFESAKYLINAGFESEECFSILSKLVSAEFHDELAVCVAHALKSIREGLAFGGRDRDRGEEAGEERKPGAIDGRGV